MELWKLFKRTVRRIGFIDRAIRNRADRLYRASFVKLGGEEPLTVRMLCETAGVSVPEALQNVCDTPVESLQGLLSNVKSGSVFVTTESGQADIDNAIAAMKKGAICCMTPQQFYDNNGNAIPSIVIPDVLTVFKKVIRSVRDSYHKPKIIAITGSVGKTTTKQLLLTILGEEREYLTNSNNLNAFYHVSYYIQKLNNRLDLYIQEVGARFMDRVKNVSEMLSPDCTIITNISCVHVENYGNVENILNDKLYLARNMQPGGIVVLNDDNDWLHDVRLDRDILRVSMRDSSADMYAEDIHVEDGAVVFTAVSKKSGRVPVKLHIPNISNISNVLCCFAVGEWLGLPLDVMAKRVGNYRPEGMRQNLKKIGDYTVYVDCFNANPAAVESSLRTLQAMTPKRNGRRVFAFGYMAELGDYASEEHRRIGEIVAECGLDKFFCYGKDTVYACERARELGVDAVFTENREELNRMMIDYIREGDIVLFKGSHGSSMGLSLDAVFGTNYHMGLDYYGQRPSVNGCDLRVVHGGAEVKKAAEKNYSHLCIPAEATVCAEEGEELCRVISISEGAFMNCCIVSMEIPDSVVYIGKNAFCKCTGLQRVRIPASVHGIDEAAFKHCRNLKEVIMEEGLLWIGKNAFSSCPLQMVEIPESVCEIAEDAFKGSEGNLLLVGGEGSTAEKYARSHNIRFMNKETVL